MDEDELELKILEAFVGYYERLYEETGGAAKKCAVELDMRDVVRGLTGLEEARLTLETEKWMGRLASRSTRSRPDALRPCSDGELYRGPHRHHARAYREPGVSPAWDRIRELRRAMAERQPPASAKEREQKFGILLSPRQAERDFAEWSAPGGAPISVLFIDIDGFKALNTRHTEAKIDQTILPEAMRRLERLARWRGGAYRWGGEEFLILLPNQDLGDAAEFAEKVRSAFESPAFEVDAAAERVTVSVGIATWPDHGGTFQDVVQAANTAERRAKQRSGNAVELAGP